MTDNIINAQSPDSSPPANKRKYIYVPRDEAKKNVYVPINGSIVNVAPRDNTILKSLLDGDDDDIDYFDPFARLENQDDEDFKFDDEQEIDNYEMLNDEVDEEDAEMFFSDGLNDELWIDGSLLCFRTKLHLRLLPSDFVYENSSMTMKSLCRYLLCLKSAIGVGDGAFTSIVGSIISFLPRDNLFISVLEQHSSTYKVMNIIYYFAELSDNLQTYKFLICDSGSCILKKNSASVCDHGVSKNKFFHYMPIRQRVEHLLKSDLKNLFLYPIHKNRSEKVIIMLRFCYDFVTICYQ